MQLKRTGNLSALVLTGFFMRQNSGKGSSVNKSLIVLKFGSSIIASMDNFRIVADEIRRYVDRGEKVVAVVSAMAGETDRLFQAIYKAAPTANDYDVAEFVATGEQQSAILLNAVLIGAGIHSSVALPIDIGLVANGETLNAVPVGLNSDALELLLDTHDVLIVPGFFAQDERQRTVLLGRGGSDNTALFLANEIQSTCKLIKDVNGIFEWDPALKQPMPRRYAQITWSDALSVANELVQDKAIVFARKHAKSFEVTDIGSTTGTIVGPGPTALAAGEAEQRRTVTQKREAPLSI